MVKRIQVHKTFQDLPVKLQVDKEGVERKYNVIWVSELNKAPLERFLKIKYNVIGERSVKAIIGSIFHKGLEYFDGSFREDKRLVFEYKDWVIVGVYDYFKDGVLIDYKTTSQVAYEIALKENFKDYYWQLQIYRWLLYKVRGEIAEQLKNIFFILENTNIIEVDYEPLPYEVIEEQVDKFLTRHKRIEACTEEERWKRVKYVVDNEWFSDFPSALAYANMVNKPIEEKIIYLKCEKYCPVNMYCPLFNGGKKS